MDSPDVVWYLRLTEEDLGPVLVVRAEGRIFNATVADLGRTLAGDVTSRRGVILDLSAVDYVNGAGLRLMERAAASMWSLHCQLVVCGLQPIVKTALDLAGVDERLAIEPSRDAAITRLGGMGPPRSALG